MVRRLTRHHVNMVAWLAKQYMEMYSYLQPQIYHNINFKQRKIIQNKKVKNYFYVFFYVNRMEKEPKENITGLELHYKNMIL